MYHPSRGGVRGGSDQFTWDTVKSDKHRENYLGHSVMAPVGRWQKGKDLSWYAKERKAENEEMLQKSQQMAMIKKAEENAMLVALGFKPAKKEEHSLAKEEMAEALKRNVVDQGNTDVERIVGVGVESASSAMLANARKQTGGIMFETYSKNSDYKNAVNNTSIENATGFSVRSVSKSCKKKKTKDGKDRKHRKRTASSENELTSRDIKKRKKQKKKHRHHRHRD